LTAFPGCIVTDAVQWSVGSYPSGTFHWAGLPYCRSLQVLPLPVPSRSARLPES